MEKTQINQFATTGRLSEIFEAHQVSDKFRKREFILELEGQYPEFIKFQLVQDNCGQLDRFQVGMQLRVEFNLRGRAFTKDNAKSYFTNLEARQLWNLTEEQPKAQL